MPPTVAASLRFALQSQEGISTCSLRAPTSDGIKLAAAVIVGSMVLVGWAFDIAVLKNI
jgi:hypothetical protein